ncbi:MAG: ABC transporter substrate-binding protein [Casimicrobiaceae bacterium]|nr:ABC transporter substrate-binding protein [Casimicrobiaceae bacterium]MCX8098713.1 ABC transporter substrate-binding protein [Casimicrobiaceae bacterium]MDW8312152.1 ABC transporter substrate-binding protein [Burkholderiales bacterium]
MNRRAALGRLSLALGATWFAKAVRAQPAPARVVSVAGSITEIVYALGAERSLVAVDTTSLYPEAATRLPKVGYLRALSAEGILALKPDLVLATVEAGPPTVMKQLTAAGVRVETLPAGHTIEALRERVRRVAALLGREREGRLLDERIASELEALRRTLAEAKGPSPRVLFILSHGGSPQIAGQDTAAAAMIELAGGRLATGGFTGYRPLTPEAAAAAAPDVILTTTQGVTALGGLDKLLALPGLGLTPAGRARHVVALDALLLLGFGPRTPQAARDLALALRDPSRRTSS